MNELIKNLLLSKQVKLFVKASSKNFSAIEMLMSSWSYSNNIENDIKYIL